MLTQLLPCEMKETYLKANTGDFSVSTDLDENISTLPSRKKEARERMGMITYCEYIMV